MEAFCDVFVIVTNNIPNIPQSLYLLRNIKKYLIKWTITVHNIYSSKYTTIKRQWLVNIWSSSYLFLSTMAYFREMVIEIGVVTTTCIRDVKK